MQIKFVFSSVVFIKLGGLSIKCGLGGHGPGFGRFGGFDGFGEFGKLIRQIRIRQTHWTEVFKNIFIYQTNSKDYVEFTKAILVSF